MKKRTELQKKAYKRNFTIMSLRGMYVRLGRIGWEQSNISSYCGDMQRSIDACLKTLGAETQTDRLKK